MIFTPNPQARQTGKRGVRICMSTAHSHDHLKEMGGHSGLSARSILEFHRFVTVKVSLRSSSPSSSTTIGESMSKSTQTAQFGRSLRHLCPRHLVMPKHPLNIHGSLPLVNPESGLDPVRHAEQTHICFSIPTLAALLLSLPWRLSPIHPLCSPMVLGRPPQQYQVLVRSILPISYH